MAKLVNAQASGDSSRNGLGVRISLKELNNFKIVKLNNKKMSTIKKHQKFSHRKTKQPIDPLRIIPLGGLEEIGRNMVLFEYQNQVLIIDMGLQFPDEDMPGIDFIIPNIEYLTKHPEKKILGIVITHAHYDHIGAIPYLIDKINYPPIFTAPLSKGIILKRQEDFSNLKKLNIQEK